MVIFCNPLVVPVSDAALLFGEVVLPEAGSVRLMPGQWPSSIAGSHAHDQRHDHQRPQGKLLASPEIGQPLIIVVQQWP